MRKLFLGAIIAFMSSCTSMRYSEKTYVNDYTKYVNEGFYIYPSNAVPSSQFLRFQSFFQQESQENLVIPMD